MDTNINEQQFENLLSEIIEIASESDDLMDDLDGSFIETFEEAGIMTLNHGLVVTLPNGNEFQLTIVRSR